ncbi:MAG: pyridoxamine 5'-phosphate oxidase family protein [Oscillospiraceae bacterium]|jgi:nitroimidazol reductase NimA-like FMN-containing flavoprotein (pyridoxamine 5'-phosphate oxidase superfamily)|nr:pyridoxamine 5'-phosphate oxidase family protein [Oscillospiraceae bacterium]
MVNESGKLQKIGEMRRKRQALPQARCEEILRCGSAGVLAVLGYEGYPYAVPLSYVWHNGTVYFHSALQGHKLEAVRRCSKASFCVIGADEVKPQSFTTYYRSVIVFGQVRILESGPEEQAAIQALAAKYAPNSTESERRQEIQAERGRFCILALTPELVTGKEAIEFVRGEA